MNGPAPAADIISAVEFDHDGMHLATGDRGGRVVLFERVSPEVVGANMMQCYEQVTLVSTRTELLSPATSASGLCPSHL
eukprot:365763-Chlamydomonas_euryale.AAC.9